MFHFMGEKQAFLFWKTRTGYWWLPKCFSYLCKCNKSVVITQTMILTLEIGRERCSFVHLSEKHRITAEPWSQRSQTWLNCRPPMINLPVADHLRREHSLPLKCLTFPFKARKEFKRVSS